MLLGDLESLQEKLNVLKEYQMQPERILKDLMCFRLSKNSMVKRLQALSDNGVKDVMPWMTKCKENIFLRLVFFTFERWNGFFDQRQNEYNHLLINNRPPDHQLMST